MAGSCMGTFGTYQYMRNRPRQQRSLCINGPVKLPTRNDTVWVVKRYNPTDLRVSAPVPRHKLMAPDIGELQEPEEHWLSAGEAPPTTFLREQEGDEMKYISLPSTRCEEWSTLRQILPSRGSPEPYRPPSWGSHHSLPPVHTAKPPRRFPHITSPMARYVDEMHKTNSLFSLY